MTWLGISSSCSRFSVSMVTKAHIYTSYLRAYHLYSPHSHRSFMIIIAPTYFSSYPIPNSYLSPIYVLREITFLWTFIHSSVILYNTLPFITMMIIMLISTSFCLSYSYTMGCVFNTYLLNFFIHYQLPYVHRFPSYMH